MMIPANKVGLIIGTLSLKYTHTHAHTHTHATQCAHTLYPHTPRQGRGDDQDATGELVCS